MFYHNIFTHCFFCMYTLIVPLSLVRKKDETSALTSGGCTHLALLRLSYQHRSPSNTTFFFPIYHKSEPSGMDNCN